MNSKSFFVPGGLNIFLQTVFLFVSLHAGAQGFSPAEAVKKMKVPDGFKLTLVASEPMIAQPVCIEFDDLDRLWVIQYLQYPNPAGLKRVKVDRFSRTVYDKIPEPPPRGPKGADRITILSDFDNNDHPRKAKDFVTGLNLASGLAFGHGGVFVLQVPYLLFYPDKNGDDIPDSDPQVLLTGFGMEDAHSVANSLTWGPDGWLYGCQGSTVTANIRGIEFQQGIWRYHPVSKRFELFCEGGGNSWGLDFDKDGNIIYSTNFGGYRALHAAQGGYFWKQFGKHGALHNPYAYGFIDHMPNENFVGGHVTVSGIIYQSDTFPEKFRDQYIHLDTLGHNILWSKIEKNGSSFKTSHGGELLAGNDNWFAPCDATVGPDGALFFADWYDKRTAHPDPDAEWDKSNGRIYRLQYEGFTFPQSINTNLSFRTLASENLVQLLGSRKDWFAARARRILGERRDAKTYSILRGNISFAPDEHLKLESFWALYVSGGADESFLNDCLNHPSAKIRRWAVRFLGDAEKILPTSEEHLLKFAEHEKDVMARNQLASTAKRLSPKIGLQLAAKTVRDEDANDPQIPLLLWWAVEKHCIGAVNETLNLFAATNACQSTLIRETILPRLMRRYATEGNGATLAACNKLFAAAPSEKEKRQMLVSLEQGLREQSQTNRLSKIEKLPLDLQKQLTSFWKDDTTDETLLRLMARLNFPPATERVLALATDKKTSAELRVKMLSLLGETRKSASNFLKIISAPDESETIKLAALDALQQSDSPEISASLLNEYPKMNERLRSKTRDVLFGRKISALALLQQINLEKISPKEIPLEQVRQISLHNDKQLDALVKKFWGNISGGTPEEKLADIRRFNNDLRAFPGDAKNGREVFLKSCAVCHELFGEGQKVGAELTHANRADKDFLLTSIVDPSAVIRKEFLNYNVETSDGRVLSGLILEQNPNSVTLIGAKNEKTTVSRDKIVS
ncbi:MAG: PVC-type heme-binding CxxCH protein, partial [Limisphaerales bacterium]